MARHGGACVILYTILALATNNAAAAGERFFTLPFTDSSVYVGNGWLYTTPGPFSCSESEGGTYCHKGIDYFKGPQEDGQVFNIVAAAEGRAVVSEDPEGFGNFVYISHPRFDDNGLRYFTLYGHLPKDAATVPKIPLETLKTNVASGDFSKWKKVSRGMLLGSVGDSGVSTSKHLHFEIHRGGWALNKVDPYGLYAKAVDYPGSCGSKEYLWNVCPPKRYTCINRYTSLAAVPSGYAAAYSVFSTEKELLLEATSCESALVAVTLGNGKSAGEGAQYIYRYGYDYRDGTWVKVDLRGDKVDSTSNYFVGDASLLILKPSPLPTSKKFVLAYICTRIGSALKCGCRDKACAQSFWSLQEYVTKW